MRKSSFTARRITFSAILTAIVVVLQYVSNISTSFLPVSITLTLIPVVIGAAMCHPLIGGWLGFVAGFVILITGASEPFFTFNPAATILVVLLKGFLSGYISGLVYRLLRRNRTIAIFAAAAIAPIVNTGVFFLGCSMFYMELVSDWAGSQDIAMYMFTALAGINFVIEFASNIILAPAVKRIIDATTIYGTYDRERKREYLKSKDNII